MIATLCLVEHRQVCIPILFVDVSSLFLSIIPHRVLAAPIDKCASLLSFCGGELLFIDALCKN
jgi:hypothetical protein